MRENTNVTTNQNYLIGRTRQEGITTTTMGNLGGEENMRDYRIKDTLILACDHGYGNIKSCHSVFKASAEVSETAPIFSKDYVKFEDKYYVIGEGHKSFLADKIADDDYYILTLVAIAKELALRGLKEAKIHLAVGLPLKWVKAQRDSFKAYLLRNRYANFEYRENEYLVEIAGCTVMPQCYSAVAENLKDFKGLNMLVDIGNGTMNIMYLNDGRAMENKSWTEKFGVNQCSIRIRNAVLNETGIHLMDDVIENFLRTGKADVEEPYASLIRNAAAEYVSEIFDKLKDYEYNDKLMKLHFMGGGCKLVETVGQYNVDRTFFIKDICATAKGYEYYCYMGLRRQNQNR